MCMFWLFSPEWYCVNTRLFFRLCALFSFFRWFSFVFFLFEFFLSFYLFLFLYLRPLARGNAILCKITRIACTMNWFNCFNLRIVGSVFLHFTCLWHRKIQSAVSTLLSKATATKTFGPKVSEKQQRARDLVNLAGLIFSVHLFYDFIWFFFSPPLGYFIFAVLVFISFSQL